MARPDKNQEEKRNETPQTGHTFQGVTTLTGSAEVTITLYPTAGCTCPPPTPTSFKMV